MKKFSGLILLVLLILACNGPLSMPAPVAETTIVPEQSIQFTPTSADVPVPMATATAAPTSTTIPPTQGFPTFTPPTAQLTRSNEIRFPPNGTYADITDSIPAGSSKTYIVNAMKGQIMSVSVLPQADVASTIWMQVRGADGTVLCPQPANEQCLFWRGILLASQDYFVTLTPDGSSTQFVMRVAINPPGKAVQFFQYTNSATGFSLTYPDFFAPALPVPGNYKFAPGLTLSVIDSPFYENTNLSEAYLFVGSSSDAQMVATCTEPNQKGGAPEQPIGNEVINGYTFVHSSSEGVAAGNSYQQEVYRMARSEVCYEVILYLHSTNVGNYPDGTVTEFDRNGIIQRFYEVLSTFAIQ
jgi:hypothetical protein